MNALNSRKKTNDVNSELCKILLLMIEEQVEKGNYDLVVGIDLLTESKRTYLTQLGYNIFDVPEDMNTYKRYKITWD
jgi:hypothetical protein